MRMDDQREDDADPERYPQKSRYKQLWTYNMPNDNVENNNGTH